MTARPPSPAAGHPERIPPGDLLDALQWALLTGDHDTVQAILETEEALVIVREHFAWCNVHAHEYHHDDGCRDCR